MLSTNITAESATPKEVRHRYDSVLALGSELKEVKVMHERVVNGARMTLAVYEHEDGTRVYGVTKDGEVQMTGTKAEAKAFYGNWRKTW